MEKKIRFTIANKEEARQILLNDKNVLQEDKEFLSTNPVYSKIVPLFKSNYDLVLMSEIDFKKKFIDYKTSSLVGPKGNENINEFEYVSMVEHYMKYYPRILDKNYVEVKEVRAKKKRKPKLDLDKVFEYTFCLDGYGYARELKREAKEFGRFTKVSGIQRGTMMGDCFSVVGTLKDIKDFHEKYDLDGRGIYFEYDDTFLIPC